MFGAAAHAQSSVTLYGRAEATFGTARVESSTRNYATNTFTSTTTRNTGLMDGNANGLGSSRWGLRGTEDLGGGLKANFQLEQRFSINNGAPYSGRDFHGRAVVGLSGGFGTLDLGRDYTPAFAVSLATDVDGMSAFSTTTALSSVRRDNGITYTTPDMSGFSAKVQLAPTKTVTDVTTGAGTKSGGAGFNVAYASGPLYVGLGYETDKATNLLTNAYSKVDGLVLGASYDVGSFKLMGNYTTNKTTASTFGSQSVKINEFNLAAAVPLGNASFLAGLGKTKAKLAGESSSGDVEWLLGVNYSLSKRTMVFARAGKNLTAGAASSNTLSVAEAKRTAVGLAHTF